MSERTGNLLHCFQISLASLMVKSHQTVEQLIDERKDLLMTILPRGSEIPEIGQMMSQSGVSLDCVFRIKHPLFNDNTLIIDELRTVLPSGDQYESYTYISEIRYTDATGKPAIF